MRTGGDNLKTRCRRGRQHRSRRQAAHPTSSLHVAKHHFCLSFELRGHIDTRTHISATSGRKSLKGLSDEYSAKYKAKINILFYSRREHDLGDTTTM